ncbi:glutathione S-transferase T3 [Brassica rapa]|uniref:glutathione S-transferase T3 n=1 Tax=Brassica campestris TaxID=3711 RepID=UPI00142DA7B9|nr:glutathione S-transferase T3 [Brassica rapa]
MNPLNQHSQSYGYMGLLQRQQSGALHENSPYESFHSEASDFPQFSSQQGEAPTPPSDTPIGTFWERVGDYFLAALLSGDGRQSSEHLHYKQRWHKINEQTNKFCGAYAAAERQLRSGMNDNDVLKVAHDIFYSDHQTKFTLEHAWCVLRHEQKWLSLNTTKASASSKRKPVETDSQTSPINVGDEEVRPEVVKAAKAKRSNAKGKSVADITTVWEMRKDDLDRKEKLSKLAILDTLLAKTQPLTAAEEEAKNKLLAQYI